MEERDEEMKRDEALDNNRPIGEDVVLKLSQLIEDAKLRAKKEGEVVGLVSRVTPISHGTETKEIKADVPFNVYLSKRFLVGSYIGISLPIAETLILGRITQVERSDILSVSRVPALFPVEEASGMTTPLTLTIELLSEEVGGEVVPPSSPVDPQSPIFVPNKEFIKRMLGIPDSGITIGRIVEGYKELDIEVKLTGEILRHHVLVVGTTGAGKTNLLKVILRNSEIPVIVFDIQGDYVTPVARMGGNVILPITRDYAKLGVTEFINLYLKRSNLQGYTIGEIEGNKAVLRNDKGKEFNLYLVAFRLTETYNLLPEVSPFFSAQGGEFFKIVTRECGSIIDEWEEMCSSAMRKNKVYPTTQENILRSVTLLRETGVIDVKMKELKGYYLYEPNYKDLVSSDAKSVVDLRWVSEKGISSATMSAFIIADRIFELIDDKYKKEGKETPFLMIFDEAHEYFPQSRRDEQKDALERLINRIMRLGRVRGIGTILATHRPTDLNDLILTLANTKITLRADEDALKKIGMDNYASLLQAAPAGYGVMRTFSLKVHDLFFRALKYDDRDNFQV
ncbi:ATP-binding protein [Saccharolobus sp. A20]|uniref:ATP-binding protein n=1 Tax=Saccharolobus sp. A20 TaxID=1891280 RepID=UPI000A6B1D7B|nr:ATP-binding protein [Sulfolobus sp. A20]